jgi:hypothetical protein
MQANVWSREGLYLEAAEGRLGLSSAARLHRHLNPGVARQDEHGPHQLSAIGRSIVGQVGP